MSLFLPFRTEIYSMWHCILEVCNLDFRLQVVTVNQLTWVPGEALMFQVCWNCSSSMGSIWSWTKCIPHYKVTRSYGDWEPNIMIWLWNISPLACMFQDGVFIWWHYLGKLWNHWEVEICWRKNIAGSKFVYL